MRRRQTSEKLMETVYANAAQFISLLGGKGNMVMEIREKRESESIGEVVRPQCRPTSPIHRARRPSNNNNQQLIILSWSLGNPNFLFPPILT